MVLEDKPLDCPEVVRLDPFHRGQGDWLQPVLAFAIGCPDVMCGGSAPSSE
jgi:hypothetical protein